MEVIETSAERLAGKLIKGLLKASEDVSKQPPTDIDRRIGYRPETTKQKYKLTFQ